MLLTEPIAMQKIAAASDLAYARILQLFAGDVKKGFVLGVGVALLFVWGP